MLSSGRFLLLALLGGATAQVYRPSAADVLPAGVFEASGYAGRGPQPYTTGIETFNGSLARHEFPGGAQQVRADKRPGLLCLTVVVLCSAA